MRWSQTLRRGRFNDAHFSFYRCVMVSVHEFYIRMMLSRYYTMCGCEKYSYEHPQIPMILCLTHEFALYINMIQHSNV